MRPDIKLVAADMDGTFIRSDYTYDIPRFNKLFACMEQAGCRFVMASGNQYYQLRDHFPSHHHKMAFVAENGAFVKDKDSVLFTAEVPKSTVDMAIDICLSRPEIQAVLCGLESAYCQVGAVSEKFYEMTKTYYHRLAWTEDLKQVQDRIMKFSLAVPDAKTSYYHDLFLEELEGRMLPVSSGHGAIDLILPGCHKASGLKRLVARWGISPEQCAAFGDGGNDIEMLQYCGYSYAMANAPAEVKQAAKYVCPTNNEDGVLTALEELFL